MAYNSVYDYNFAVDEDYLLEVCDTMTGYAQSVREKIEEIYNIINVDLAEYWVSSAYENFRDTCGNYRIGLNELANMIELFGGSAESISNASNVLMTNVNNKFK